VSNLDHLYLGIKRFERGNKISISFNRRVLFHRQVIHKIGTSTKILTGPKKQFDHCRDSILEGRSKRLQV
jgi:hypothetical protein